MDCSMAAVQKQVGLARSSLGPVPSSFLLLPSSPPSLALSSLSSRPLAPRQVWLFSSRSFARLCFFSRPSLFPCEPHSINPNWGKGGGGNCQTKAPSPTLGGAYCHSGPGSLVVVAPLAGAIQWAQRTGIQVHLPGGVLTSAVETMSPHSIRHGGAFLLPGRASC